MRPLNLIIVIFCMGAAVPLNVQGPVPRQQFLATSDFLDAAIYSVNSLNSLIKKESYRNRVSSLNNPTSAELGFSLQVQVQAALEPLLKKAKKTNANRFNDVVQTLLAPPSKNIAVKATLSSSTILGSLLGMVANLALTEKNITRDDIDVFINTISKYFQQYEKLNRANQSLDDAVNKLNLRIQELQYDINEYMTDLVIIIYPGTKRESYRSLGTEDLFLKFLDRQLIEKKLPENGSLIDSSSSQFYYPGDGIKTAKEINNAIRKLYKEYDAVYSNNYREIQSIVADSKLLGNGIDLKAIERSSRELEELYKESKNADLANLRLSTLADRLNNLVRTEQLAKAP